MAAVNAYDGASETAIARLMEMCGSIELKIREDNKQTTSQHVECMRSLTITMEKGETEKDTVTDISIRNRCSCVHIRRGHGAKSAHTLSEGAAK